MRRSAYLVSAAAVDSCCGLGLTCGFGFAAGFAFVTAFAFPAIAAFRLAQASFIPRAPRHPRRMPKKTEARSLRELVRGDSALFPDASEPLRSYANDGEWLSDGIYGKIPRGNFLRDMISGSP